MIVHISLTLRICYAEINCFCPSQNKVVGILRNRRRFTCEGISKCTYLFPTSSLICHPSPPTAPPLDINNLRRPFWVAQRYTQMHHQILIPTFCTGCIRSPLLRLQQTHLGLGCTTLALVTASTCVCNSTLRSLSVISLLWYVYLCCPPNFHKAKKYLPLELHFVRGPSCGPTQALFCFSLFFFSSPPYFNYSIEEYHCGRAGEEMPKLRRCPPCFKCRFV